MRTFDELLKKNQRRKNDGDNGGEKNENDKMKKVEKRNYFALKISRDARRENAYELRNWTSIIYITITRPIL